MKGTPEAFRDVVFWNTDTWPNATLAEWVEMRRALKSRQISREEGRRRFRAFLGGRKKALAELRRRERAAGRQIRRYLTGRQAAELERILRDSGVVGPVEEASFSSWESRFLDETQWIEAVLDGGDLGTAYPRICRMLINWVLRVEEETDIRGARERTRSRKLETVSNDAPPGFHLRGDENQFLPHALDLIGIYRRAHVITVELQRRCRLAEKYGLVMDEYGAAFPCPKCSARYCEARYAIECHPKSIEPEAAQTLLQTYLSVTHPRSEWHKGLIADFIKSIRGLGHDTPRTELDLIEWPGWDEICEVGAAELTRSWVGYLFSAMPDTIRRKLNRSTLQREYGHWGVADSLRVYLDRSEPRPPHAMFGKEWFMRLDGDGCPATGPGFKIDHRVRF